MDIRKSFFMEGMVGHCNRLPREMMVFLSMEVFKRCVDVGLGTWFSCGLDSVRLDLMIVKIFSNQNDSLIL